jgi:hypothetical protein
MTPSIPAMISRRNVVQLLSFAAACAAPAAAWAQPRTYDIVMHRAGGCGCCRAWAEHLQRTSRFRATTIDETDMQAVKRRLGVPADLTSCHTGEVEGFVIEGHVPADNILRLLSERPSGVRGLAVPGMPIGSPGMESGERRDPYQVFAFRADGTRYEFSRHGG